MTLASGYSLAHLTLVIDQRIIRKVLVWIYHGDTIFKLIHRLVSEAAKSRTNIKVGEGLQDEH